MSLEIVWPSRFMQDYHPEILKEFFQKFDSDNLDDQLSSLDQKNKINNLNGNISNNTYIRRSKPRQNNKSPENSVIVPDEIITCLQKSIMII